MVLGYLLDQYVYANKGEIPRPVRAPTGIRDDDNVEPRVSPLPPSPIFAILGFFICFLCLFSCLFVFCFVWFVSSLGLARSTP